MEQDFFSWLRLEQTSGVGPATAAQLLSAFGTPQAIFTASPDALRSVVSARVTATLLSAPDAALQQLHGRIQDWCAVAGNQVLTRADPRYPSDLLEIPDPPLILYVKGRVELLRAAGIGMVGSRHASTQGVRDAAQFAEALSQAGLTVVSGLAAGIDAAAHQGALRGAGSTIAVIGTGADIVYPARHRSLAHQIAETGCLVSEYPLGTPAIASNFPRRNRIISGLSKGVLVVEAAAQSGSLITARMAAEQGRDVFAIPGSIHSPLAKGCHQLIRQGAKLAETAQDILDELPDYFLTAIPQAASASQSGAAVQTADVPALLTVMGFDPLPLDVLAMRSGLEIAELSSQLLALELAGELESLPGGFYRRLG